MKFSFHNRLKTTLKNKTFIFYNKILNSLYEKLAEFGKYNSYITIASGASTDEDIANFHLTNPIATIPLESISMQNDITKGELFAIYQFKFTTKNSHNFITEIGLSNNDKNPTIYNYFSLISDDLPNGLNISNESEISFEITINLTLTETNNYLLTAGNNPFISFLLGNGIDEVYLCSGSNFAENKRIERQLPINKKLLLCNKKASINNNILEINFSGNINTGEVDEVLFITNNQVFARMNTKEVRGTTQKQTTISPSANYVIKFIEDTKQINSITKTSDNIAETNYFVEKYANSFGDKVSLPFNNMFDNLTSRFISKDGKLIFFVNNNLVYAYKNNDFSIEKIDTREINDEYITNIIAFDEFIFVISQIEPYISTYIIENKKVLRIKNNFNEFTLKSNYENITQSDAVMCKNGNIILGLILDDKSALSIYLNYNSESGLTINNYLTNSREFNYILAMNKNNFCDGRMIYLKSDEVAQLCRIVTHSAEQTETDVYNSLAYALSNNSTKVYSKGRAVISEKKSSPYLVIYYYPQIYEYNLPLLTNELKNYLSNDLYYLIQKDETGTYKIYNLVGYDNPEEFIDGFDGLVEQLTILDFEFMKDTLLIFTSNTSEPIVAFNLKLNKTQIENVSSKNDSYLVDALVYNKLGTNDENINFNFITRINL